MKQVYFRLTPQELLRIAQEIFRHKTWFRDGRQVKIVGSEGSDEFIIDIYENEKV